MWSRLNTPRIPRSILTSVVAIFLLLFTFIAQHSLTYVKAGMIMASYTLRSSTMTPFCFSYDPICTCNFHFARSSAYSSSHGSSNSISWDILHNFCIHIIRSWLRRMLPHWLSVVLSDYWLDIHSHQLRNQNSYYIQQIRTNTRKSTINFSGPKLWNTLPANLRQPVSIHQFKKKFKALLLTKYS